MKVLVIPDVHLQTWIFYIAHEIMQRSGCDIDRIVVLGDVVDSHENGENLDLFAQTFDVALKFAGKYKDKLIWLHGNHEISYLDYRCNCKPHNYEAEPMVHEYIRDLKKTLGKDILVAARIDSVLFSHAGITEWYGYPNYSANYPNNYEWNVVVNRINNTRYNELWEPRSPIWFRPDGTSLTYKLGGCLQVAGHTPLKRPYLSQNLLLTDTFHEGCAKLFPIIDTETHQILFMSENFYLITDPLLS